jgi:hypothetical protein
LSIDARRVLKERRLDFRGSSFNEFALCDLNGDLNCGNALPFICRRDESD